MMWPHAGHVFVVRYVPFRRREAPPPPAVLLVPSPPLLLPPLSSLDFLAVALAVAPPPPSSPPPPPFWASPLPAPPLPSALTVAAPPAAVDGCATSHALHVAPPADAPAPLSLAPAAAAPGALAPAAAAPPAAAAAPPAAPPAGIGIGSGGQLGAPAPVVPVGRGGTAAAFAPAGRLRPSRSRLFCLMLKRAPHETQNWRAVGFSAAQCSHFLRGGVFGAPRWKRGSSNGPPAPAVWVGRVEGGTVEGPPVG